MTIRFRRVIIDSQNTRGVMNLQITLKAARMNVNLTQSEAAEKIGVTVDTIGNWERAKSFPNALQIRRIEEVYGIPYNDLIFLPNKTLKA